MGGRSGLLILFFMDASCRDVPQSKQLERWFTIRNHFFLQRPVCSSGERALIKGRESWNSWSYGDSIALMPLLYRDCNTH
jgi:hypothetical protein